MKINYIIALCLGVAVLSGAYLFFTRNNDTDYDQVYEAADNQATTSPDSESLEGDKNASDTEGESVNNDKATSSGVANPSSVTASATTPNAVPTAKPTSQNTAPAAEPSSTPVVTPTPVAKPAGITMSTVSTHNSAASCWSAIAGKVYDLTTYIPKHPGGKGEILAICGKDGSAMFDGQHGGDSKPEKILSGYYIDNLSSN